MFPGRTSDLPLLRTATLKPSSPLLHKETPPSIIIKQGPLDKREKAREKKDKGPSKEEILKKVNALMDDLANHSNIQDAITAFKDLKIPERFLRHAICTIYSNTLDRGDSERDLAAKLVSELKKETIINAQQLHEGWKELVASIPEKESVPCVTSHVAFLTAKAIVDNLILLTDLTSVTENGQYHPLFLLTLQQLHRTQGKAKLLQIFNSSKVNLISQLPEADKTKERLGEILEDRELTFLCPLLRIQGDMWRQIQIDSTPNALYKWIKEKLDPLHYCDAAFINALMNVLLKYITQVGRDSNNMFPTCIYFCIYYIYLYMIFNERKQHWRLVSIKLSLLTKIWYKRNVCCCVNMPAFSTHSLRPSSRKLQLSTRYKCFAIRKVFLKGC